MVASDQVLATGTQLDTLCINTIRTLAIDAVQQANSGHPGAPMGAGARGLLSVAGLPALRSRRSDLAQSRPLRSLERTRVHAAVRDVAPRRSAPGRRARQRHQGTRRLDGRHQALPATWAAGRRDIRSRTSPPGSKRRRGRSDRESATASEWRSRASGRRRTSIGRASKSSISTCTRCARTAT